MRTIGYIPPKPQLIPAPPDPPKTAENAPQEKPAKKPGKGAKQDG